MFQLKQVEELKKHIGLLQDHIKFLQGILTNHLSKYVECEVCGCLLNKNTATKGSGEIRQKYNRGFDKEDFIYYPFYCKVHQPKVKK
jgi:hypothetical protein